MIVLGLAGPAGAGKNTVANYLAERYGFIKFAFNDSLNESESFVREFIELFQYPEQAPQYFVVQNCQTENERDWIHSGTWDNLWTGNVWHIHREGLITDTLLAVSTPEREIFNNGTIEQLYQAVDLLIAHPVQHVRVDPVEPMEEPTHE